MIRSDFRSVDFDIGFPLQQSHIHNVFEPVNIINVDNGQTEKTTKSPVSGFAYMGIALPGKGRDGFG